MVEVRVGDEDMGDAFAGRQRGKNGVEMCGDVRTRIDHRDVALAQNVSVGAAKRHRRGIRGEQAPQTGFRAGETVGGCGWHFGISLGQAGR